MFSNANKRSLLLNAHLHLLLDQEEQDDEEKEANDNKIVSVINLLASSSGHRTQRSTIVLGCGSVLAGQGPLNSFTNALTGSIFSVEATDELQLLHITGRESFTALQNFERLKIRKMIQHCSVYKNLTSSDALGRLALDQAPFDEELLLALQKGFHFSGVS